MMNSLLVGYQGLFDQFESSPLRKYVQKHQVT